MEVGGRGSGPPGSWGETRLRGTPRPFREAQGACPCRADGPPPRPPSARLGDWGPRPGIGGPGGAAPRSPFPARGPALAARAAPSSLAVQGSANSCSKPFSSSVLSGDVCSKPAAYFKNISVKHTPSLRPPAGEGRGGPGPFVPAGPGPPFPCEVPTLPRAPASVNLCSPFLLGGGGEKRERKKRRKKGVT